MEIKDKNELSLEERDALFGILKTRFEKYMNRHPELDWKLIQTKLIENPAKLRSIFEMERTGGEPDVVGQDSQTGEFIFFDCSLETPSGRRNICYDQAALEARKKFPPEDSAMNVALSMGIEILSEEQYRFLQNLGRFDLKTSSWVLTPSSIRKLGGALFMDRRYDQVFLYHNGADSYYAVRGFRGWIKV